MILKSLKITQFNQAVFCLSITMLSNPIYSNLCFACTSQSRARRWKKVNAPGMTRTCGLRIRNEYPEFPNLHKLREFSEIIDLSSCVIATDSFIPMLILAYFGKVYSRKFTHRKKAHVCEVSARSVNESRVLAKVIQSILAEATFFSWQSFPHIGRKTVDSCHTCLETDR